MIKKRNSYFVLVVLTLIITTNFVEPLKGKELNTEGLQNITCKQASELIMKDKSARELTIIDFRPEKKYSAAHIKGALFHDVFADDIDEWLGKLDRGKKYLIYCTIGHRSGIAFKKMKKMNFTHVLHMNRGISQWEQSGYEIETGMPGAQSVIAFNEGNWKLLRGKFSEFNKRLSLAGTAMLLNTEFEDGIIEFDIYVTGKRSYPGIIFRSFAPGNAENIYIRPHILGLFDTALQYTPVFNNSACWQLYSGEGYTNSLNIKNNEWVRVRLEVSGVRARVFVGDMNKPVLMVENLKHGKKSGKILLTSPPDGSAYFSNFTLDQKAKIDIGPPRLEPTPPGVINDWEISQPFKYTQIDIEKGYNDQPLDELKWKKVTPETSGLVNVSGHIVRRGTEPDFIFARTTIKSETAELREFKFGYSDWIQILLNGKLLYSGSSPYRGRGTGFQGIIGYFDAIYLPLKKGENELQLMVGESFGGWGFMFRDGKKVLMDKGMKKIWESGKVFTTSESVLYDRKREILYVTNFDQFNVRNPKPEQFISKVSLDGKVLKLKWVEGLNNPLGMEIHKDHLFVAERLAVAEINLKNGKVIKRHQIPGSVFLNDLTIDKMGRIYITDSRKNVIWRYDNGKAEEWLKGDEVADPNTIYFYNNKILFGNSDDRSLKLVDPETKEIITIARFEKGFIDGIRIDSHGNYLVSLWHGILYRVTPAGVVTEILDTTAPGYYIADFEYIKEKNLLLVPTFFGNTIAGYELK